MSRIDITPEVWRAEEHIAETYRSVHDDRLPETPFWNWVNRHYLDAVETGHLARFEHWHGPLVTSWEEQDHAPLSMPVIPPVIPPECVPTVPVPPIGGQAPGTPTVPEPSSVLLLGLGVAMLWVCLLRGMRRRRGGAQ